MSQPTEGNVGAGQRLDKVLAAAGLGSRKQVRTLVRSGRVTVAGRVERDPSTHVSMHEVIAVDGVPLVRDSMTFMLAKPAGYVCAVRDARHPTVLDLFPPQWRSRLFPAGRLDKDTEGLLIVTDDGPLCHRLISPRFGIEKEYVARLDGAIPPGLPEAFAQGVVLDDGYRTLPARLCILEAGPPAVAALTLTEGKYHQVKRMFAAFGLKVTELKRVRIGALRLDERLSPGEFRRLTPAEVDLLLQNPPGAGDAPL